MGKEEEVENARRGQGSLIEIEELVEGREGQAEGSRNVHKIT